MGQGKDIIMSELLKWNSILFPEKVTYALTERGEQKSGNCEIDCTDCPNAYQCLKLTDNRTDVEYQMDLIAYDMAWLEIVANNENPDTIADAIVKLIGCQIKLDRLGAMRC